MGLLIEYKFENVDELPRSDIVFDHEKYPKLSNKIVALYNKYIVAASNFQLNLSAQVRSKWIEATVPLTEQLAMHRRISTFGRRLSSQIQRARGSKLKTRQSMELAVNSNSAKNTAKQNKNKISSNLPKPEVIHEIPSTTTSDMNGTDNSRPTTPRDVPSVKKLGTTTEIIYIDTDNNEEYKEVPNGTPISTSISPNTPIESGFDLMRSFTTKRKKTMNNEMLKMNLNEQSLNESIDEFRIGNVDIDVDLNIFLPLIQRVLEQCHLLLMDSYSRFKLERDRKVEYDMYDKEVVRTHTRLET